MIWRDFFIFFILNLMRPEFNIKGMTFLTRLINLMEFPQLKTVDKYQLCNLKRPNPTISITV